MLYWIVTLLLDAAAEIDRDVWEAPTFHRDLTFGQPLPPLWAEWHAGKWEAADFIRFVTVLYPTWDGWRPGRYV